MTEEKLSEILQILRSGLAKTLGSQLEVVYLYGSHARGEATSDSDIDILIVTTKLIGFINNQSK